MRFAKLIRILNVLPKLLDFLFQSYIARSMRFFIFISGLEGFFIASSARATSRTRPQVRASHHSLLLVLRYLLKGTRFLLFPSTSGFTPCRQSLLWNRPGYRNKDNGLNCSTFINYTLEIEIHSDVLLPKPRDPDGEGEVRGEREGALANT